MPQVRWQYLTLKGKLPDVITHPEMLTVARLLITRKRSTDIRSGEIADRLGFPTPAAPTRSTRCSFIWPASSCYAVR